MPLYQGKHNVRILSVKIECILFVSKQSEKLPKNSKFIQINCILSDNMSSREGDILVNPKTQGGKEGPI
jgi:hypothetical protein